MNARLPVTDFLQDLAESQQALSNPVVWSAITEHFPNALSAHPCHVENDKRGADLIIELKGEKPVLVDLKLRKKDYATHRGDIDVALELSYGNRQGWATKPTLADFYLFISLDTGRSACFGACDLLSAVATHSAAWREQYRTLTTITAGHGVEVASEAVIVPASVVSDATRLLDNGVK